MFVVLKGVTCLRYFGGVRDDDFFCVIYCCECLVLISILWSRFGFYLWFGLGMLWFG